MKQNAKGRLSAMLVRDKEEINESTRKALLCDLTHVANEYFDREGELALAIEERGERLEVQLRFFATRVKNFTTLK